MEFIFNWCCCVICVSFALDRVIKQPRKLQFKCCCTPEVRNNCRWRLQRWHSGVEWRYCGRRGTCLGVTRPRSSFGVCFVNIVSAIVPRPDDSVRMWCSGKNRRDSIRLLKFNTDAATDQRYAIRGALPRNADLMSTWPWFHPLLKDSLRTSVSLATILQKSRLLRSLIMIEMTCNTHLHRPSLQIFCALMTLHYRSEIVLTPPVRSWRSTTGYHYAFHLTSKTDKP